MAIWSIEVLLTCCFLSLFYTICRLNLIFADLYSTELRDVRDEVFDDFSSNHSHLGSPKHGHNNRRSNVSLVSSWKLNYSIFNLTVYFSTFSSSRQHFPFYSAEPTQDQPSLIPYRYVTFSLLSLIYFKLRSFKGWPLYNWTYSDRKMFCIYLLLGFFL